MSRSSRLYFLQETYRSVKVNGLMSIASISTVALSLLILGLFLLAVLNMNRFADYLESQVEITVYMKDRATVEEIKSTYNGLKGLSGVVKVTAVDKAEAMERFRQRLGEQQDILEALGSDNPFPNSFEVQVAKPEIIEVIAPVINKMPGVETARFGQEVVDNLFRLAHMLRWAGLLLVIMFAAATTFLIANTIRITVFARRREVSIMKYVGATDWFIRWPFLFEGMILGFIGAFIASIILVQGYAVLVYRIHSTLTFLPLLPVWPYMGYMVVLILILGTALGAGGSAISLRKYLDV